MDQTDIYLCAVLLIKRHGEDAVIEAVMKADAMLERGDLDGAKLWKAIVRAIDELQREDLRDGERIN
jgi:hypothetical protein